MTQMSSSLSGGKLLVILEGGYDLRFISSSAVAVIQVLLGELPGCELDDAAPSPAGLRTVLEVLKVQMNHWPFLNTSFLELQSKWSSFLIKKMLVNSLGREYGLWFLCGNGAGIVWSTVISWTGDFAREQSSSL